ncbi:hypothetical protein EVAR_42527_1 [Eumeta japonica]|uniref:Uncharacterized protein n=1 Tax=Eumeta variegata TaxID=151549 RepID=A0A4C1WUB9_EUMVA|nr:hypothetical protein EVAR_42527_1 [Eumeta japonica]
MDVAGALLPFTGLARPDVTPPTNVPRVPEIKEPLPENVDRRADEHAPGAGAAHEPDGRADRVDVIVRDDRREVRRLIKGGNAAA